ncbi:MAG: HD domain-containing protein [Planctomycetota bacterium]|nr:HD domain-containing protein [Planctomycetota bacterium]
MPESPLLRIPELTNLEAGRGIVRIPMEQDVPFTPRVRALVDTPEFQRLQHVTQLGLAARVYPGATHTRFEHALGVFHNSIRYLWQLASDERFRNAISVHQAEVLMASALLHDLGHWPFCHPIEDMSLPDLPPHEEFAAQFLAPDRALAGVLRNEWGVEPDEVLDVLVAKTDSKSLRLMRSILSGPIDIDKMDYLERDSLHAGVPYGRNFDKNRLIQSLLVNAAGDGLAISVKGKTAAEMMVFARYVMFSEVYWHHTVRSATSMFARAFYRLHRKFDLRELFMQTEHDFVNQLRAFAADSSSALLVEGVFGVERRIFKRVQEYSLYQSPELYSQLSRRSYLDLADLSERLAAELSRRMSRPIDVDSILIDAPPPHREVEFKVDIYFPKEGVFRPLSDVSPVVESLAKRQFDDYVKRVRIFVRPDLAADIRDSPVFAASLIAAIECR